MKKKTGTMEMLELELVSLREKDRLHVLLMGILQKLLIEDDIQRLINLVADLLEEALGINNVWVFEKDEEDKVLRLIGVHGPHVEIYHKEIETLKEDRDRFIQSIWESFKVDVVRDCRKDKRINQTYVRLRGFRTAVHVPMRLSGKKFGILACATFDDQGCREIDSAQISLLENLAALLAIALNRINGSVELQKSRSGLTELVEKWESFARYSTDIIIHVNREGRILYVNHDTQYPVIQKSIFDFLPLMEEHDRVRMVIDAVFDTFQPMTYQATGYDADGKHAIYYSRISPVIIDKTIVYATIVSSDVTQSIHNRLALEKSEFRYRSLIDNLPSNIYIKDLTGCYLDVNKTYLKSLGFKKSEVIGKTDYDLFPKKTADIFRANDQQVLSSGQACEFEEKLIDVNGETIFLTVKYPLYSATKKPYALGGISTDMTARIRNRIRVQESETRYRELADNSPLAIVIHQENKIIYANRATMQLLGASTPRDLIGREIMDFVHPSSVDDIKKRVRRIYARKGNSRPKDHKLITIQGKVKDVELVGTMITYKDRPASQVILRDITFQKQWEQVISRYEHIVNSTNDKLSFIDTNYIYCAVNKSYYKMHGEAAGEIVGRSIRDVFGTDIFENNIRPHFDRCLQGETINYQYWFTFDLVGKRFMDVTYYPYREKSGAIGGVVVSSHDITERKLIEDELLLLNRVISASTSGLSRMELMETTCRELAMAFDAARVVISLLNSSGDALIVTTAWPLEIKVVKSGYSLLIKDIPGFKELQKYMRPIMINSVDAFKRLGIYGELLEKENIASVLVLPITVNKRLIGAISLDCKSKRKYRTKQIETIERIVAQLSSAIGYVELQEQQKRMATALQQTFEKIIITDPKGRVVYVNPAFEESTGYSCDEIIGYGIGKIKSGRQDGAFYHKLWRTILAGKVWRGRFVNKKKSGELFYEDATITPIRDEIGEIVNFVSVQHDVTKELELEKQLRQSQKMEAVGQLVGGVAHDFNNLLTSIMSYAGFALEYNDVPLNSRTAEDLRGIIRSAERAAKLTRQLLTFAKKQVTSPKIININHHISEMESMLVRLINENIRLTTKLDPSLKTIKIDPAQFEQVLVNLVVNARDAMPDGGHIRIETVNVVHPPGNSVVSQPGEYILLRVTDTGSGIPRDIQERIFEPFFTTKPASQGTGLGLSTCFGIIHKHGGTIDLESTVGQGTVFKVYFPCRVGLQSSVENNAVFESAGGSECILLVEDENALREVVARGLRQKGYQVLEAENGKKALKIILEQDDFKPDILLSDVMMPEIGGKKLIQIVAQHYPDVKILLMSGYADIEIDPDQGAFVFLQKPFQQDVLYEKIRMLLDKDK